MTEGARRRDAGIIRTITVNRTWADRAIEHVASIRPTARVTGEDIRERIETAMPDDQPSHHNAWGALVLRAISRGLLIPTDDYEDMRKETSHARRTRIYIRAGRPRGRITRIRPPTTT